MVVFEQGRPALSEYRHFKIKTLQGPNDIGMMKEVLQRRLNRDDWTAPNLIIIDGGKGQLRAARSVVKDTIPTISLVKNPDRLLIPIIGSDKGHTKFLLKAGEANKQISPTAQR